MDKYLTIGAAIVEIGLPISLIYFSFKVPTKKYIFVPILGSITPMLLVFVYGSIDYLFVVSDEPSMFLAIFSMGFLVYCLLAVVGFLVGLILPNSINLYWRFGIGLLVAPLFGLGFIAIW